MTYTPCKWVVYIAGPISKGDLGTHVRATVDVANRLQAAGVAPIVPHLQSVLWWLINPPEQAKCDGYAVWLPMDFAYIQRSDAVLRLPGESAGADQEVAFAESIGVPVFYDVEALLEWLNKPWMYEPLTYRVGSTTPTSSGSI